jgi:hypothetical protein
VSRLRALGGAPNAAVETTALPRTQVDRRFETKCRRRKVLIGAGGDASGVDGMGGFAGPKLDFPGGSRGPAGFPLPLPAAANGITKIRNFSVDNFDTNCYYRLSDDKQYT